jgi:hypothetical protein
MKKRENKGTSVGLVFLRQHVEWAVHLIGKIFSSKEENLFLYKRTSRSIWPKTHFLFLASDFLVFRLFLFSLDWTHEGGKFLQNLLHSDDEQQRKELFMLEFCPWFQVCSYPCIFIYILPCILILWELKFSTKVEDETSLMNFSNYFWDLILPRMMFNWMIKIVLASY